MTTITTATSQTTTKTQTRSKRASSAKPQSAAAKKVAAPTKPAVSRHRPAAKQPQPVLKQLILLIIAFLRADHGPQLKQAVRKFLMACCYCYIAGYALGKFVHRLNARLATFARMALHFVEHIDSTSVDIDFNASEILVLLPILNPQSEAILYHIPFPLAK